MRTLYIFLLLVLSSVRCPSQSQTNYRDSPSGASPQDVVEQLWIRAAAGDFLDRPLPKAPSQAHLEHTERAREKSILVISNHWGLDHSEIKGNDADVIIQFEELGTIDSKLRFKVAQDDPCASKMFAVSHVTLIQSRWQLTEQGIRYTPLNAAIRYVMERRGKTTDPELKNDADHTIALLLHYR